MRRIAPNNLGQCSQCFTMKMSSTPAIKQQTSSFPTLHDWLCHPYRGSQCCSHTCCYYCKSTCRAANANRSEGICIFSVTNTTPELCSPRQTNHDSSSCINPATSYHVQVDPLADWRDYILTLRLSSRFTCCTLISRFKKMK